MASPLQLQLTMRIVIAFLLCLPSIAVADDRADLAPSEVRARIKALDAQIARCYRQAWAGAGRLDITLDIHRKGIVDRIIVATPGLPAKLVPRVDSCVREVLANVTFPARRVGTIARLPYVWQRTPGARPAYSCWSPKGCRSATARPASPARARRGPSSRA